MAIVCCFQSQSEKRTPTTSQTRIERAEEVRGQRTEQEITSLKSAVDVLQFKLNMADKDNKEINSFLTDLLYTLNARGYETVTDHRGHTVDLYRCRGEHLLDLKGRDARARMPVKKLVQQENLLKAVIGSQERFIQSLISQLQDRQKDALVGVWITRNKGYFHDLNFGGILLLVRISPKYRQSSKLRKALSMHQILL